LPNTLARKDLHSSATGANRRAWSNPTTKLLCDEYHIRHGAFVAVGPRDAVFNDDERPFDSREDSQLESINEFLAQHAHTIPPVRARRQDIANQLEADELH